MSRRALLARLAVAIGVAAVLAAGYAAAGPAGLVDAAAVAAAGVLVLARATVPGRETRSVRPVKIRRDRARTPAARAAEFPAYRKIAADLSWGLAAHEGSEYGVRRTLARLATALDRPQEPDLVAGEPPEADGPGLDLATLERAVARLEEPQ
jgi:hypothetical protein